MLTPRDVLEARRGRQKLAQERTKEAREIEREARARIVELLCANNVTDTDAAEALKQFTYATRHLMAAEDSSR